MPSFLFTSIRTLLIDHAIEAFFKNISYNFLHIFQGGKCLTFAEAISIGKFSLVSLHTKGGEYILLETVMVTKISPDEFYKMYYFYPPKNHATIIFTYKSYKDPYKDMDALSGHILYEFIPDIHKINEHIRFYI